MSTILRGKVSDRMPASNPIVFGEPIFEMCEKCGEFKNIKTGEHNVQQLSLSELLEWKAEV